MKRIITNITGGQLLAVSIVPTLLSVVSCGQQAADRDISAADSLSEAAPQRAMTLIDSLEGESTMNKSRHMKLLLLKAKVRNKLAMPMSTDSLKDIADYFDKHGDSNERMLAYYILGCAYFDGKDAPMALQYFHEAAAKADTTDSNCDFKNLSRIYTFLGEILYKHLSPENALIAQKQAIKYAKLAKDTLNAICGYQRLTETYYYLGKYDSVISISDKSSKLFQKYGYINYAASSYGIPIFIMVENGETNKVKPYLRIYEKESGLYDTKVNKVKKGHEIHYYIKGMCYLNEDKLDSAEYFFRKELNETSDYNNHQAAAKGLYMLYKKRCNNDSVTKYAEMWNAATDSAYARMSTEHLQQMQAMYNYNANKLLADKKNKEAITYKYWSIILIFAFTLSICIILLIQQKRKKDIAINQQLNAKNTMNLLLLEKKEKELDHAICAKIKDEKLIKQKTAEIEELNKKICELCGDSWKEQNVSSIKGNILNIALIEHLHVLSGTSRKATYEDKKQLISYAERNMPNFMNYLNIRKNKLSDIEILICILIKFKFITSEITCLLDISSQRLTTTRRRLNNKIFGNTGGAKDFDYSIKRITPDN